MLKYLSKKMIARFVMMMVACAAIYYFYVPMTSGEIPMRALKHGDFYFGPDFGHTTELTRPNLVRDMMATYHDVEVLIPADDPNAIYLPIYYISIYYGGDVYHIQDYLHGRHKDRIVPKYSQIYVSSPGVIGRSWVSTGKVESKYLVELEKLWLEVG